MEPNAISIAQTKFEPSLKALAIYLEDLIVGFGMYNTVKEELGSYWIYRIMVHKTFQGRGIASAALLLILEKMKQLPECSRIAVSYHPENKCAHYLYAKLGFIDRKQRFGKEMVVMLDVEQAEKRP